MVRATVAILVLSVTHLGAPSASTSEGTDLFVHLAGPAGVITVPEEARLTATVMNLGQTEASSLQLTVELDEALEPMAADQGPWSCSVGATVTCALGALPAGAAAEVNVAVAAVRSGAFPATATVAQTSTDPDPSNDAATVAVTAAGRPCDVVGTAGPDTLRARGRGDVACGLRGDDVLLGGDGRQFLHGGRGRDAIGGRGHDRIDGGPGRDACAPKGRRCEVRGFATASSLPLFEPSGITIGYGYHQSLFGTALGMRPLLRHRVMESRGRGTGATTAVDIVVPSGGAIRSPVKGTVVAVERYLLYCRTRDWKVVLAPRSHPRLRVLVLHMARPAVREGDEVAAGSTLLGRAGANDGATAQVNRYFPHRYAHVHVEVERDRATPTPGCDLARARLPAWKATLR